MADALDYLALGDVDNDGDLDGVTASEAGDNVSLLLGDGAGSFATGVAFDTDAGPRWVALGDVGALIT